MARFAAHGYYATLGYGVPGFSLDAEYKYYRHIGTPFNVLPPIRRWVENAAADADQDRGYGVNLNWNPTDDGSQINVHYTQDQEEGFPFTEVLSSYSSPSGRDFHMPVDVQDLGIDFLSCSAYKLLGPFGIGALWGRYELLDGMGRPPQMISELVRGKKALTAETALQLEEQTGLAAYIWLGLENQYQLSLAKQLREQKKKAS